MRTTIAWAIALLLFGMAYFEIVTGIWWLLAILTVPGMAGSGFGAMVAPADRQTGDQRS